MILVNILGKSRFWSISSVKLIWVKIFPKSWFWSKKCRFGQDLPICRFWSKIYENLEFGQNFRKISILVKILKKCRFGQNFKKSRIW